MLSHTLWVLSAVLGYVKREGFVAKDASLFEKLVSSVSIGLADTANAASSGVYFIGTKRRQFYISHLPAFFPAHHKRALLKAPLNLASYLFSEIDISNMLNVSHSTSSLKSQQALLEVVSKSTPSSPKSPGKPASPNYKRKNDNANSKDNSKSPKRVRFSSPSRYGKSPPPPSNLKKNFRR